MNDNLHYKGFSWSHIFINSDSNIEGLAYHQVVSVFQEKDKPKMNVNAFVDEDDKAMIKMKAKEEGIYLFGGICGSGYVPNNMYVMKFNSDHYGKKNMKFAKLNTVGERPDSRAHHSMTHFEKHNLIIIHGGRNDNYKKLYYNDLHILDTCNMNWCNVSFSKPMMYRSSHNAAMIDNVYY